MLIGMHNSRSLFRIDIRILKQTHPELYAQYIGNGTVKILHRKPTVGYVLLKVGTKGISLQVNIYSCFQCQCCSFRIVFCHIVVIGYTLDAHKVGIDHSVEAPLVSEHIGQEIAVACARNAVNRIV